MFSRWIEEPQNRIVGISDSNSDTVAEYTYDALGRRIEKKDLVDRGKTVRYYYNNGWSRRAQISFQLTCRERTFVRDTGDIADER